MASAEKPWTAGISGRSCSLRRRRAGYGLASRPAIISSVTVNESGSSPAGAPALPAAGAARSLTAARAISSVASGAGLTG